MGKWKYRKPEPSNVRGICIECNEKPQRKLGDRYAPICEGCNDRRRGRTRQQRRKPYTLFKKDCCEYCGFVPIHLCQLDVDHIDGNHSNNDPSNLKTLCANCHRLKTYLNKDWQ